MGLVFLGSLFLMTFFFCLCSFPPPEGCHLRRQAVEWVPGRNDRDHLVIYPQGRDEPLSEVSPGSVAGRRRQVEPLGPILMIPYPLPPHRPQPRAGVMSLLIPGRAEG